MLNLCFYAFLLGVSSSEFRFYPHFYKSQELNAHLSFLFYFYFSVCMHMCTCVCVSMCVYTVGLCLQRMG